MATTKATAAKKSTAAKSPTKAKATKATTTDVSDKPTKTTKATKSVSTVDGETRNPEEAKAYKKVMEALSPAHQKLLAKTMKTAKELKALKAQLGSLAPVKELESKDDLNFLRCSDPACDGIHFRHAGYIELCLPYVKPNGQSANANHSYAVKVCINCKKCYIFHEDHFYDITKHIDLNAWEKLEEKAHKMTGPGGDC